MVWVLLILRPILVLTMFAWLVPATTPLVQAQDCLAFPNPQDRFGFNVALENNRRIDNYTVDSFHAHWYLDYATQIKPSQPAGMVYAQMIRPSQWAKPAFTTTVQSIIETNPGALWLVGNEPDRDKQDGLNPGEYAAFYHDVYSFIKTYDQSSHVAIAGVVQSTPLRRRYLDMVLTEYENRYGAKMPIDVMNMHAFILREADLWGAAIPPGLEAFADEGMRYEIGDHSNLTIFQENIFAFRQWMAANGYRDKPLLVTEYGILLPDLYQDFGIDFSYSAVRNFMWGSFDYFLNATDETVGYPADGNRLVQGWSWFSLNYPPYDLNTGEGHNGNLVEPTSGLLLPLGRDYGNYVAQLDSSKYVDIGIPSFQVNPSIILSSTTTIPTGTVPSIPTWPSAFTLEGQLQNTGTATGCNLRIHLWHRTPDGVQTRLQSWDIAQLTEGGTQPISLTWQPQTLRPGLHEFFLQADVDNAAIGLPIDQAEARSTLLVLTEPFSHHLYLPIVDR